MPSTLDGSCKKYAGWNVASRRQEKVIEAMGGGPGTPACEAGDGTGTEGNGDHGTGEAPSSTTSQGSQKSQESQGSHGSRGRKRIRKEKKEEDSVSEEELKRFIEGTKMKKKPRKASGASEKSAVNVGREENGKSNGKSKVNTTAKEDAPKPQSLPNREIV